MEIKSDIFSVVDMSYCLEISEHHLISKNDNVCCEDNTEIKLLEILKNINWQKFHNLCVSIGKELNDPQWRFLKAIFLENAVAEYSNCKLSYVGDKEKGCDFRVESLGNIKVEMKYTEECLYGKKGQLKQTTKSITLVNSRGTNTYSSLPEEYSEYLLIVEMNGAALVSKEILQKYVSIHGDSLSAKVPTDELHIIFEPSNIIQLTKKNELHIKETIMNTIIQIIQDNK
jgi:hypothetical protein